MGEVENRSENTGMFPIPYPLFSQVKKYRSIIKWKYSVRFHWDCCCVREQQP